MTQALNPSGTVANLQNTQLTVTIPPGTQLTNLDTTSPTAGIDNANNFNLSVRVLPTLLPNPRTMGFVSIPATFSGTILGYTDAPTLQYSLDNVTWNALPANAVVTVSSFSFVLDFTTAGTYTVYLRDPSYASQTTVKVGPFPVVLASSVKILVDTPPAEFPNKNFTFTGSLTGYPVAPSLAVATGPSGPWTAIPAAQITSTAFSGTLNLRPGQYEIFVTDTNS